MSLMSLFLLLFCSGLLPCCLFVLHSFQLGLLLGPFLPPLVDVVLQLFIKLILLGCHHLLPLDLSLLHLFFLKFSLCSLFLVFLSFDFFLLFSFGLSLFLLLFCPDLLPCCLFVLHSFQLCLLLGPFLPPLVDVVLQLFVKFILLNSSFPLGEGFISLHGGVRHGFIFIVRHCEAVKVLVKSVNTSDGFLCI